MHRDVSNSLQWMLELDRSTLIFEAVVGSRAYGTARPESDEDRKGIYVEPAQALLTLQERPSQRSDPKGDTVYFSLRRFLELALGANPNIIELLFMPEDCIRQLDPVVQPLLESRNLFVTRQAYVSHVRYAQAQIKKARGQNKWINHPQPEKPPGPLDFCWFVPAERAGRLPYRPLPLAASGINLDECHAASLEHAPHLFRLYHYGPTARGVFRGDSVVCESIPIEDETSRCIGLLIYNQNDHERAVRDHENYWTWKANRNEERWIRQESGQLDYDAKNMMHMFRLMLSAEHILTEGQPKVRFDGPPLDFLLAILRGEFAYAELIQKADQLSKRLEELHERSLLPESPDPARAETLLKSITREWEARHA